MISYRFKRRAFLGALGGGAGLKLILRNAEVSAQTATSPPRFLATYWPLSIIPGANAALWTPTTGPAGGYALQPFLDQGLAADMITIRGISAQSLPLTGGGSREGGMVTFFTGVGAGGTRANRGESDDAFAVGPSIDQVLLKNTPALGPGPSGLGSVNSICDNRSDLGEVSAKCMSYSHEQQPVMRFSGATSVENKPLLPTLSPLAQYTTLFSGLAPGSGGSGGGAPSSGGAPGSGAGGMAAAGGRSVPTAKPVADEMLKQLAMRRSVLDFGLAEITRMKGLVPGGSRHKLQIHFDAVQTMESSLASSIDRQYPSVTGTGGNAGANGGARGGNPGLGGAGGTPGARGCRIVPAPPPDTQGMPDWETGGHGNYGSPKNGSTDDMATHQLVGQLHMDVFRAAFVCDLIRCGTFQWAPATSHVGFKGLWPGDEAGIYQHHAVSGNPPGTANQGSTPDDIDSPARRFLFNVECWYFSRHAEILKGWKDAVDHLGNPLLDSTIVPFVTETDSYQDSRSNIPAMIFGGKKLGMQVGQYKTGSFSVNSLWGTIAVALGCPAGIAPLAAAIPGLWAMPVR